MNQIILNNHQFTYEIQRKPIRSLRLKLTSPKSFLITCPHLTPQFVIQKFIKTNSEWIIKNSQKIISKPILLNLEQIIILGRNYEIKWIKTLRDSVIIDDKEQIIYANISTYTEKNVKKVLEKRFRSYALNLIKSELKKLSDVYKFDYSRVSVKNQKSRYGSCSSQGNLNFNWQIIFFPYINFRHILLHELTHLKIKNHSKTFWDQLTVYDPACKNNNHWLKIRGTKYFLF